MFGACQKNSYIKCGKTNMHIKIQELSFTSIGYDMEYVKSTMEGTIASQCSAFGRDRPVGQNSELFVQL